MPPLAPPPTNELGAPGIVSFAGYVDTWEETPELRFPFAVRVYDRMRRTDAQIDAVLRAVDLPIRRTGWSLSTDGVDPRVAAFVRDELGLDLDRTAAARRRRRRQGIVWADVLRHALLARPLGFMPLEQVYEVGPPGPGQESYGLPRLTAHVRKLAPRMPRSVTAIDIADDGGLTAIRQHVARQDRPTDEVIIPADRLVMFVNEREGADWTGRSCLRSSYGHWLIKTQLLKLGPVIAERNGMGIPVVTFSNGQDRNEALDIATKLRAGETAGVALPEGMALSLVGVEGSLRDELPLLKYHDEAIGRAALAMVLNLGHDNGARSLGDTFLDLFLLSEQATIVDIEDTVTEYVIRDLVELNYGEDEPYPVLKADELAADAAPTAEALKSLADAGLLDGDPELKADVRRRFRLPAPAVADAPQDAPTPAPTDPAGPEPIRELPAGSAAPGMTADELLKLVNAAAALIRSGFSPDKALTAVGLDPIEHLGLLPVTVQKPEQPVAGLSAASEPTALDVARALAWATEALATPAPPARMSSPAARAQRAAELAARAAALAGATVDE
jgi:hypothetical protein